MRTIEEWEKEEWNRPSRSDYYLMQIAQAVVSQNSKKRIKLGEFKLKFGTKSSSLTPMQRKNAIELAKAQWRSKLKVQAKKEQSNGNGTRSR